MESFHGNRTPESDVLKVAALKLFHPTVPSVLFGTSFGNCDTVSGGEGNTWVISKQYPGVSFFSVSWPKVVVYCLNCVPDIKSIDKDRIFYYIELTI